MTHWPGIVFRQRPDFTFSFVAPKVEEVTGIPAREWLQGGKTFWDCVHEADLPTLRRRLGPNDQPADNVSSTYRLRHHHTGKVTHVLEHRKAIRGANGSLVRYEGMWLDVSRQTLAERRLLTLSWKENLGTLTMGLTHDFCNMMTGIAGLSETFEASLEKEHPLKEGLGLIRKTAVQASQLAQRIRQLHYGTPGEKRFHDLNEVVKSLAEVLQKVIPRRVSLGLDLDTTKLPVYFDTVEFEQVLVNLALNSVDAMPEGGRLTFRSTLLEQAPAAQPANLHGQLPPAPLIQLSVSDTGTGIPHKYLASIFDPFFTTKPLGKGSGLGLYNAHVFVEKHAAAISVETEEGCGTTFHLWFAQADLGATHPIERPQKPVRHTLLLAGATGQPFEQLLLFLRQNGYYVVPATTPAQLGEALHSPYYHFTGCILFCADSAQPGQFLRQGRVPPKTLLSVQAERDELPSHVVEAVDEIVPFALAPDNLLSRVRHLIELAETPAGKHGS